jgi:hypothetical protein
MRKSIYTLAIAAALLPVFSSCKKIGIATPNINGIQGRVMSVAGTVTAGAIYQLNLSQYGTSSATILQQVTGTYIISEIITDAVTGGLVYRYSGTGTPKTGESATDQVILNINETGQQQSNGGCNGGGQHTSSTKLTINLTIK